MADRPRPVLKNSYAETEELANTFRDTPIVHPVSEGLTGSAQDKNLALYAKAKADYDQRQKAEDALYAKRKADQEQQAMQQRNAAMPALQRMTGMPTQAPQVQPNKVNSDDLGQEHADLVQRYQQTMNKQNMQGKVPFTDEDQQNIDDYNNLVKNIHPGSQSGQ